jgi:hypothetical protein
MIRTDVSFRCHRHTPGCILAMHAGWASNTSMKSTMSMR